MLSANDARITGVVCVEADTGSSAGVVAGGIPLDVLVAVEVGAALFSTGARFAAGVQVEGIEPGAIGLAQGHLGCAVWPEPSGRLRFRVPGPVTAGLVDRLLGVSAFLRVNAAPPFLVCALRGPDVFVSPGRALYKPPAPVP